ncbi:tRNA-dihydrouridine(20) synthase (NAD(+)) NDAI_0K01680 [Naumovozyma dairenensis CBS 421]|uniref:tRNA-dihydrouridine(20) synthase [NAD(P)+] n=1 Tax=Naumovozyma dairenensis (strain ATCC 10597 / BCRC 20456 / CBS 421 / NBRC 0211 / NRRL Y-12639) TaxID=1071378 RepID=G0WHU8_NAUDC|nr:hypothetical protein NDAI_0K01680 [Naumovozyma dairenensis CBS 421]CCD27359.1 hypothetical protein NDAI_0K01680 [Naumovozyma dairenensis CBS 421]
MVKYASKLVLAPMVRAGELPSRLLALRHGCDLVWSPEIIDKKLLQCRRLINTKLNTIDYVTGSKDTLVFRSFPRDEAGKLIFQMGTASPELARDAALKIIQDVDGIDVNAGCPKHFSIHAGMGAALLQSPEKLCDILKALVENVGKPNGKPISVKIRLLDDQENTFKLVEDLCQTGIQNLTVHCRTTPMRNREKPIRDYLKGIFEICQKYDVSLIMNGAINDRNDFIKIRDELNLSKEVGGMIAEAAERNLSVFNPNPLTWFEVCKEYIQIAKEFDNHIGNTKYMLTRIVPGKSKFFQLFAKCKYVDEISYVASQIGPDGELLEDPTPFLEERREREKLEKKKLNDSKSQEKQRNNKRSMETNSTNEIDTKKIKA